MARNGLHRVRRREGPGGSRANAGTNRRQQDGPRHLRGRQAGPGRLDGQGVRRMTRGGAQGRKGGVVSSSGQPSGCVGGVVGDDDVGAGALYARQGFEDGPALVEPSVLGGGLDHGVLPTHVVGGEGKVGHLADAPQDVKVRQRWLDHHDVSALLDVEVRLDQRLAGVGRVHLVATPVAELGGALGGVAERAVEGRGVLGRIRHSRGVLEAFVVELGPDRRDAPVHHVGGRDYIGSGLGLGGGGAGQELEADVVEYLARLLLDDPAVSVAHVLAQAHDRYHEQFGRGLLYGAGRELDDPLGIVSPGSRLVFLVWDPEEENSLDAEVVRPLRLGDGVLDRELEDSGNRGDRAPDILPRGHEYRVYKVLYREPRLAHEPAQARRAPRSSQSLLRERHPTHPSLPDLRRGGP